MKYISAYGCCLHVAVVGMIKKRDFGRFLNLLAFNASYLIPRCRESYLDYDELIALVRRVSVLPDGSICLLRYGNEYCLR